MNRSRQAAVAFMADIGRYHPYSESGHSISLRIPRLPSVSHSMPCRRASSRPPLWPVRKFQPSGQPNKQTADGGVVVGASLQFDVYSYL